ncbi:multifunctional oxoglutarate decarboxylase/oxoglutarate dehydrogenase thiamine pyrophosphate-binding subunit/dihydrolipoyllysine-residue succinyltransferase subunit [Boudabousia marimammalium]|uniref:2-oxoglutarate dehydrogenase E1 component n=1 Tax=Boudabousia marimammalium TaxID=156892 RepID=A0A1Q5PRW8_9ACTO|nr:multifunctional oxoglutarate decarboxylase/oxoglutarate dehydrogenase thiamine pyrophosphate-binding subunit/dihydrolipoyllysine-residue succinyltransferase subunit [Boudabousia marimammalium]OKL50182.1 2-oxoglutarate dehydrogenase E1 component [Boudabousia marimammalium]
MTIQRRNSKPDSFSFVPSQQAQKIPPRPPVGHDDLEVAPASEAAMPETSTPQTLPNSIDISRSDLPPLPPVRVAPPTSTYVRTRTKATTERGTLDDESMETLHGVSAAIARNMEESLQVPTATSARTLPVRVMIENRRLINAHLARTTGGKVSFTHLISYALLEAMIEHPDINVRYELKDGKPAIHRMPHIGFGIAVDVPTRKGRALLVPVLRKADTLSFPEFWRASQDLIDRARAGKLTNDDFVDGTVTLTNPGVIGTVHSVPRLMKDQSLIIGVGAMDLPAEWAGASIRQRAHAGVGKVMTVTSTYDHRVIQGALSGMLLRTVELKLTGQDGFYDRIFDSLRLPIEPLQWAQNHDWDAHNQMGKSARVSGLIHAYRSRGHLAADTDPLHYRVRRHPDLRLEQHGLSIWDLDTEFPTDGFRGTDSLTLREILSQLRDTYSRSAGIEYMHIHDPAQRRWMQDRIERPYEKLSTDHQRRILSTLNQAEAFETFLQTKYQGQKRFSLEGGETLIPILESILYHSAQDELDGVAIGMAHRGRLNVLANIAGKSYAQIFREFEGGTNQDLYAGSGDVKYHLGTEGTYTASNGKQTAVYLAANPSHLEAADGVLEGIVRGKLDALGTEASVLPILIHGDAAFIGQGVVYETLNMSQLAAYRTGGTIHVIVNNQIGFTTGPTSARSTNYCTDLAKGLQVPIFHINADDPETAVRIAHLAYDYRQTFNKDVIIDMVCYRRRGHNEGDDPSMTQPVMYGQIDSLPSTREVYTRNLIGRGDITEAQASAALAEYKEHLNEILTQTREEVEKSDQGNDSADIANSTTAVHGLDKPDAQLPGTAQVLGWQSAVSPDILRHIGSAHVNVPEGFSPHPKLRQLLERRQKMSTEGHIDWGYAETLAFGSLLLEGTPVRLAGEDSRRGTFVQRHAVLHDQETGREWTPLQNLAETQGKFSVYDSSLSEFAPMAFEYGYSVERPDALVLWEAQFGDFANGAQTVMDQFISSAEQKWGQRSSVVLLLPHGFEGQGPDHSSARIERYLQLCAEDNMLVTQPSTPANYFHLLRTQAYQRPRKPLIVFTPKQLLRLPAAQSAVADFTKGGFLPVIGEHDERILGDLAQVNRVLLCSGRIYYDLLKEREARQDWSTAIIRLEQLYPLNVEAISAALTPFGSAEHVWVQDEPKNQGIWSHLALNLPHEVTNGPLRVVSRPAAASTSTGSPRVHRTQNAAILKAAFDRD